MVNEMAHNGGIAIGFDHYDGHHASVTEEVTKISFDEGSRMTGLCVLIDSCLGFTFTGDGFVVTTDHRDLLDKAHIQYQIL